MDEVSRVIRDYYDSTVEIEWNRVAGKPEFLLTCRMIDRYVRNGDSVLDIGGGPGQYSLYLAGKGCHVTLLDLSVKNTEFAEKQFACQGFAVNTIAGDARDADRLISGRFDHILLMGPMYHLLEEGDRVDAVNAALTLLKPGGIIFVSFINLFSGMIYAMRDKPDVLSEQSENPFIQAIIDNRNFAGFTFTHSYFALKDEILPFMTQFPLEKLHLFGQEGIIAPCEDKIMSQPKEIIDLWLELC